MNLLDKIGIHLSDLRNECGSWRKRGIKSLITEAEDCIKQNKEKNVWIDCMILAKPFIKAYEEEGESFQNICLDSFIDLFNYST